MRIWNSFISTCNTRTGYKYSDVINLQYETFPDAELVARKEMLHADAQNPCTKIMPFKNACACILGRVLRSLIDVHRCFILY